MLREGQAPLWEVLRFRVLREMSPGAICDL